MTSRNTTEEQILMSDKKERMLEDNHFLCGVQL
jgi:hypothetical protein